MEQILPALESQLRRFRRGAAWLSAAHPQLGRRLGLQTAAPDAHVDRLVQGVAILHARTALALQRARMQQDEHLLQLHFPEQLRPFPACAVVPTRGAADGAAIRGARYCPGPEAAIELDVEPRVPGASLSTSIYIDGDAAFSAALRSALLGEGRSGGASVRWEGTSEVQSLPGWPVEPTGLEPEEALLPRPPGAHAGLALLREYFTFPARFNVLRLELPAGTGRCTVRLPAPGFHAPAARLLETLLGGHLRAGWAAQAGLRRIAAAPVLLDRRQSEYLLSVPPEMEIFAIDRVRVDGVACHDWVVRHVEGAPAGYEWRIAFAGQSGAVASIEVTCCQRSAVLGRPARGSGCRWRLNSLLALEQSPPDACALRELMATQAVHNSPAAQAIIGAVSALDARRVLLDDGRAAPLQGTELRLEVDEAAFAGSGLLLFAQVMDRFFGECAHLNTFTRYWCRQHPGRS
jgi:type VI secretion system protein ImpG